MGLCRRVRSCAFRSLPLLICVLPILSVEFLSFWAASFSWRLPANVNSPGSTTLLIVADPQLIGHKHEPEWIGRLSRWDADRYLSGAYQTVLAATNPHFEVFLGDLFDEGALMSDTEFLEEKGRFLRIFPPDGGINRIYVPGDNDIGGEMEPVYARLYERFKQNFPSHFVRKPNSKVTIYTSNPLRYGQLDGIYGGDGMEKSVRIVLSHFPIVPLMTTKMEQELRKTNIVLSGHDHTTALYMQWRHSPQFRRTASALDMDDVRWSVSMESPPSLPLIEFKAPTVSYRMGVPSMGYGLLVLTPSPDNRTALAQFSVLWLPSRYLQLYFYLALTTLTLAWILVAKFWRQSNKGVGVRKKLKKEKEEDVQMKTRKKYSRIGVDV